MKIKVIVTLKNGVLDPQGKAIQQTLNGYKSESPGRFTSTISRNGDLIHKCYFEMNCSSGFTSPNPGAAWIKTATLEIGGQQIDKITGNIIRITNIFKNFKPKIRDKIKPAGFIIGLKNIYLSTNKGRILVIDVVSGKTKSTLKIDKDKISRPIIKDKNLYVVKDNAIIRLN